MNKPAPFNFDFKKPVPVGVANVILKSRFIEMAELLQAQNCAECDAILNDLYNHQLDAVGHMIISDDIRLARLMQKYKELSDTIEGL